MSQFFGLYQLYANHVDSKFKRRRRKATDLGDVDSRLKRRRRKLHGFGRRRNEFKASLVGKSTGFGET